MADEVEIRVHDPEKKPALVYLPGLHGDWTLVGSFRRALNHAVCFIEATYPRTLRWSLDEYGAAVEAALAKAGVTHGWLLGESFGSQVLWALVERRRFGIDGVILAGGFVRHPALWGVRLAHYVTGAVPMCLVRAVLRGYRLVARLRFRRSPEVLSQFDEFIARRTELDRQAAQHRLRLIATSNHGGTVRRADLPVYALTGLFDPIVPWPWVMGWLKRHCPSLRQYRILARADHTVLSTAPDGAAQLILGWVRASG